MEVISRDAYVVQPMVRPSRIDEACELTPMFDGDDHLPDAEQHGGEGLAN